MTTVTKQLEEHIQGKITYHQKLRLQCEAEENYEQCAVHRDEIIRLKKMLHGEGHYQE